MKYGYAFLIVLLIVLLFALSTISDIEKPLEELSKLPRCKGTDIVITNDLRSRVINFAVDRIKQGTGESYFYNHFLFHSLEFSTDDCVFTIKYEYVYDELHKQMSIDAMVLNSTDFEIVKTNTFMRPVGIIVDKDEAETIALQQNVDYDYYNKEILIPEQTIVYRFYKETLTQGTVLVLEIDAQSSQITTYQVPQEFIPIV